MLARLNRQWFVKPTRAHPKFYTALTIYRLKKLHKTHYYIGHHPVLKGEGRHFVTWVQQPGLRRQLFYDLLDDFLAQFLIPW